MLTCAMDLFKHNCARVSSRGRLVAVAGTKKREQRHPTATTRLRRRDATKAATQTRRQMSISASSKMAIPWEQVRGALLDCFYALADLDAVFAMLLH